MDFNLVQNMIDSSFAANLHPDSRVWIYHADRVFNPEETDQINKEIASFCKQWVSHNRQLKASGKVLLNRIILLMVDETNAGASGCSIDTSVAFVKNIGLKYKTNLFDRMLITYLKNDIVGTTSLNELKNTIVDDSEKVYIFDNLIKTKRDLVEQSIVPIKGSWVERFI